MDDKDIKLEDLVTEASMELLLERKKASRNLIKVFFTKAEDLTEKVKLKKQELARAEESLEKTLQKIERLKKGDWSVLKENQGIVKVDSEHKPNESL